MTYDDGAGILRWKKEQAAKDQAERNAGGRSFDRQLKRKQRVKKKLITSKRSWFAYKKQQWAKGNKHVCPCPVSYAYCA